MATLAEPRVIGRVPGAGRFDFSRLPRLDAAQLLRRSALQFADADIVVDLGDSIGSGHWWRGVATLGALSAAAMVLALNLPIIPGSVPSLQPDAIRAESRMIGIGPMAAGSPSAPRAAPTPLARPLAEAPERPRVELTANVGSGGLEAALRRAGVGRADLDELATLLNRIASTRGVSPGSSIHVVLGRRETKSVPRPLEFLSFRANFETRVDVRRAENGELVAKPIPIKIDNTPLRVTGVAGTSLQRALRAAGLPASVAQEYVRQLGYAIDVHRDVGRRDQFEVIMEHRRAETGETQTGRLLYAGLINGRSNISLMRWGDKGDFFWQNGEAVRKGLMRTPIAGARLTSGFGMRFHPVLGYSRMHRGIDFGAPTGTPILASAAGTVVFAGWGGGYGNVVVIDHGRGLRTRYAHMHRIGVRNGQQVAQGQSIGQVGSTGLSTGPHLHYEVWQNGTAVDPRSVKFFSNVQQLSGQDLQRFKSEMARLKALKAAG